MQDHLNPTVEEELRELGFFSKRLPDSFLVSLSEKILLFDFSKIKDINANKTIFDHGEDFCAWYDDNLKKLFIRDLYHGDMVQLFRKEFLKNNGEFGKNELLFKMIILELTGNKKWQTR